MSDSNDAVHHILQVEDSEDDALLVQAELRTLERPLAFRRVESAEEMQAALAERRWDLVISDHRMPRFDAIRAFDVLRGSRQDVPFIILSGNMPEEIAATAMRLGADDFVDKSNRARLVPVVERELRHARLRRESESHERRLVHLSYHDTLTGLPNAPLLTKLMEDGLPRTRERSRHAALITLDLDRFMRINDTLGYAAGDALLRMMAQRLVDAYAREAVIARVGQDKFALYFEEVEDPQAALATGESLARVLAPPFELAGEEIFVTAAVGLAVHPDDGEEAFTLLHHAEAAMFAAKKCGPASVRRYAPRPGGGTTDDLRLENALRHAVERDELFLLFQPLVDMRSRCLAGAEALVRWRHPRFGVVGPDKFIRIADETGLIVDVGRWVLGAACRQSETWRRSARGGLTVAVNVSAAQFAKPGFEREVRTALDESGLDPSFLELEITETVVMQDAETNITTLSRLKNMGVRISIDDFGTGYSSLSYLKRFPIDVLKIDRSFLSRVTEDSDNQAIVRTIVALAKSLKLEVVAEGVETQPQFDFLRDLGCDRAQGYLIGRPAFSDAMLRER
jgi:diguanylate cyclase (GGDEF)-like protein